MVAEMRGVRMALGLSLVAGASASPDIQHFAPHALVPGKTVTLTFSGKDLNGATGLWTSFGAATRQVTNANSDLVSFEVDCPADAAGIGALQLYGESGASGFQLIAVDELPFQPHSNQHHSKDAAQRLNPPAAVDCILKKETADWYVFSGKAGEVFSVEIMSHRLGSEMDSAVTVRDAAGNELAFCDDEPGTSRDSRFQFACPVEGDYYLVVHDMGYGGGPAFDYRLRLGKFPVKLEARLADGSNALIEVESNDGPEQAQQFGFPALIQGRIGPGADYFAFLALKDQKLVFQSATRSINSPCDLHLRILKEGGGGVIESNPAAAADAALTNTFKEAGLHTLEVRELSGGATRTDLPYQIRAAAFVPGFTLESEIANIELKPGATATLKVKCARYDFDGPIALELLPPMEGITIENAVIPEKKNEADLAITVSNEWRAGSLHHFRIQGKGANATLTAQVSTTPALSKTFPLLRLPPPQLDGLISLSVKKSD